MKAKLLKKIRKRFGIYRYDDIGTNPPNILIRAKKRHSYPFYILIDHKAKSFLGFNSWSSKDINSLLDIIIKRTKDDYTHKVKPIKIKCKKVWHI